MFKLDFEAIGKQRGSPPLYVGLYLEDVIILRAALEALDLDMPEREYFMAYGQTLAEHKRMYQQTLLESFRQFEEQLRASDQPLGVWTS
jgi:hypothetical protein